MTLADEYLNIIKILRFTWRKTLVLTSGQFFECYAMLKPDGMGIHQNLSIKKKKICWII